MTIYAIGDVQGCYKPLRMLLDQVCFDPAKDRLWCAGDLVNRGPESLATLRFLKALGKSCIAVLGNHDLHLLEHVNGGRTYPRDTFEEILSAPDRNELITWLRHRPLFHHDATIGWGMVHAGMHPDWDLATTQARAREVELQLQSKAWKTFCRLLQKRTFPDEDKTGREKRLLFTTAVMTRSRYCTAPGRFNWQRKHGDSDVDGEKPWFMHRELKWRDSCKIIFGHWAALGIVSNQPHVLGLDSGCVWGGKLTIAALDKEGEFTLFQQACPKCLTE